MSTQVPPSRLDSTKDFSSLVPSAYAKANAAFAQANAAFSQANTGAGADSWARDTANAAFITANSAASFANGAFDRANAAYNTANNATDSWVRTQANNAYDTANSSGTFANGAFVTANSAASFANGAFAQANAAFLQANNSTDTWVRTQANNAYDTANSGASFANGAFTTANSTASFANGAFDRANAAFDKANTYPGNSNQVLYKNSSNVLTSSSGLVYDGVSIKVNGNLESTFQNGDEGGEIFLSKSVTNTTLTSGISIDVFQNKLRIFETGGSNRGVYIDMANGASGGIGTNLLAPPGGSVTSVSGATGAVSNTQLIAGIQTVSSSYGITFDYVATANNGQGTNFKVGDDAWIGDFNTADSIKIKGQQSALNGYVSFGSNTSTLGAAGTGQLTYGGNIVWHAGNDGAGSGLDADLLDGLNSSEFARVTAESFANGAFDRANAAYAQANTGGSGTDAWARDTANASFLQANSAASFANGAFLRANSSYAAQNITASFANSAYTHANAAFAKANAEILILSVVDETTNLTVSSARASFRAPSAMTLTSIPRATLNVASTSGLVNVDIKVAGTTILGTNKLTIDATEKTSTTAVTATSYVTTSIADDAEFTIDILSAGTGAKGLKVIFYYND